MSDKVTKHYMLLKQIDELYKPIWENKIPEDKRKEYDMKIESLEKQMIANRYSMNSDDLKEILNDLIERYNNGERGAVVHACNYYENLYKDQLKQEGKQVD